MPGPASGEFATIVRQGLRLTAFIAVPASEQDAAHLGVEIGEPLIEIRRVARDYQDTPIELRTSRLTTRQYCYASHL